MPDPFQKVRSGDDFVISAAAYNAFIDAVAWMRRQQRGLNGGGFSNIPDADVILVKNTTGEDLPRFAVAGLDGPVFGPDDNLDEFLGNVCMKAVTPTETDHAGRFVILQEPLADEAIGRAWASGCCPVRIEVQDEGDTTADVMDGDASRLKSGSGAAQILWKNSGNGQQWGFIRFGGGSESLIRGRAFEDITTEAGGNVALQNWNGSTWVDTETEVDARVGLPLSGAQISLGRVVWMIRKYGEYWIIAAECEEG